MTDVLRAETTRRLRGAILQLLYENHRQQQHRLELVTLGGALERLFYDVPLNDLITVLQDLKERGYVDFVQEKDKYTYRVKIARIEIRPRGRDVVEGTLIDAGVLVNE